jgi:hypothetical protein
MTTTVESGTPVSESGEQVLEPSRHVASAAADPETEAADLAAPPSPLLVSPLPDRACLNCDLPLDRSHLYCPRCGQDVETSRVSFGDLVREAWGEFVQIDSKLTRTLVALAFRPGWLTREYLAGKRVRYLSPFKMYLVVAALFFALASWVAANKVAGVPDIDTPGPPKRLHPHGLAINRPNISWNVDGDGKGHPNIDIHLPGVDQSEDGERPGASGRSDAAAASKQETPAARATQSDDGWAQFDGIPPTTDAYNTQQRSMPKAQRDSPVKQFAIERGIRIRNRWQSDKGGLVSDIIGYFPGMMFVLLPVCALLLRLLYARREWLYVEHLIFALHLHTVFFLICGTTLIFTLPGAMSLPYAIVAGRCLWASFFVYGFVAARRVYRQGVFKTLFKGALLVQAYLAVVLVAVVVTIMLALARI